MQGKRIPADPTGRLSLNKGDYGWLEDVWWACPPDGQPTIIRNVEEHSDGTISAEFASGAKKYRIDHGVWQELPNDDA